VATYRLTRHARRDLLEIWQRIAEDDEPAADRFIDLLIHHFQILGENPRAGTADIGYLVAQEEE
jgi:plasmid stabilization system protein ParE